jgi:riboflavin synthase
MFTGLVESVGRVRDLAPLRGGVRLTVEAAFVEPAAAGDSIATNGVCLTVVEQGSGTLVFDVGPATLEATAIGHLRPGDTVNLERAMRADTRIGGHFVQGHVDGVGRLIEVRPADEFTWLTFAYPPAHAPYLIPKGAVAVDGISLTVATLADDCFDVQIVPFTWTHTNLSALAIGAAVNLEFDMLGKYAVRAAEIAARRVPVPLP